LPDQDGKVVKPSEYKGKWLVLYFYPNDDTPGCTTEACDFTNASRTSRSWRAAIVGCKPPNSLERPQEVHRQVQAEGPLALGPRAQGDDGVRRLGREGALRQEDHRRHPLDGIVGPDGKVAYHWATVKAASHATLCAKS
jgi:peroxiredoxin Q/BCP